MTQQNHESLEDALVHEVWRQDLDAIKRLLASGANPNRPGRTWSSAMACAGENDETGDIVRALVAAGGDVNLQSEFGSTLLHHAVDVAIDGAIQTRAEFDWTAVAVFLDLGADATIRDARGRTVFEIASAYGQNARDSFDTFMNRRTTDLRTGSDPFS